VLALEVIRDVDARRVALVLGICGAVLFTMGWLVNVEGVPVGLFDATEELGFPAWFGATLLLASAALVMVLRALDARPRERRGLLLMSAVLAAMASDELLALHEKLGGRVGLEGQGQFVLAPLIVVAAVAWLLTFDKLRRDRVPATLFAIGASVWAASQTIDLVYGGLRAATPVSAVAEDTLESVGSTFFLLALLVAVGRVLRSRAPAR